MEATELRIGNWVYNQTTASYQQVYPMMIPQIHSIQKEGRGTNITPIPLTEEILLKCGFQMFRGEFWNSVSSSMDISIVILENKFYFVVNSEYAITKHFIYVHELQNIYFALTGEELSINL